MNNYKVETSIAQNIENEKKSFNSLPTIEIPNNIFFQIISNKEINSDETHNTTFQLRDDNKIEISRTEIDGENSRVFYELYKNENGADDKWTQWFDRDKNYYIRCDTIFTPPFNDSIFNTYNIGIRIVKKNINSSDSSAHINIDCSHRSSSQTTSFNIESDEYISYIYLVVFAGAPANFKGTMSIRIEDTPDFSEKYPDYYEFIKNKNDQLKEIINLSIQAQPGLEFYINNNLYPIIIGSNGLFSWEIKQPNTYIYSVKILRKTDRAWPNINPNSNIIITYEYLEEDNK